MNVDGQLKAGTFLTSESSNKYKVNTLLGAGGQGEVYDVECGGKHYALKWYFKHMATKSQKEILDNLITRGAPDDSFLWPQDFQRIRRVLWLHHAVTSKELQKHCRHDEASCRAVVSNPLQSRL